MPDVDCHLWAPGEPAWAAALRLLPHDIYQTPGYAIASSVADKGRPGAAYASTGGCQVLLPYIRREIAGGRWDAVSPYGYAGPVFSSDVDPSTRESLVELALRSMGDDGCVSAFLRSHPGLNLDWPTFNDFDVARRSTTPTVVIDLALTSDALWSRTASGHRYEITRARRQGYECGVDEGFQRYDEFAVMYREAMREVGASGYHLFDDAYFTALRKQLGTELELMIATKDGELAAAALFTRCGDWVQYHLSATAPDHRAMAPSKLVLDEMRRRAQAAGRRWLHLGGGRGGGHDTLLAFKAGFSPDRRAFHTAGIVLDSAEYRRLAGETSPSDDSEYFPAYRRSG